MSDGFRGLARAMGIIVLVLALAACAGSYFAGAALAGQIGANWALLVGLTIALIGPIQVRVVGRLRRAAGHVPSGGWNKTAIYSLLFIAIGAGIALGASLS